MLPATLVTTPARQTCADLAGSTVEQLCVIVAPSNGRFRPTVTGGALAAGELLGHVTGGRGRADDVRSPADVTVEGLLTLPGHLVTAGQALAWARLVQDGQPA